ncbi:IS66 family insertion sequence element accessory protein TnpA [Paenibacillus zanthoxyli]|uniref:IS66 family insertion sequence element accessory protein TnpA n=1 Tax=Paenibacillus zanthoxyli TaxID=369399 RepID=UPI0038CD8F6E
MTKAELRQHQWTERIMDYRASGLTMSAWCQMQGVTLHQLKYWLRKIDSERTPTFPPHFIPVTVSPQSPLTSLTLRMGPDGSGSH